MATGGCQLQLVWGLGLMGESVPVISIYFPAKFSWCFLWRSFMMLELELQTAKTLG